MKNYIANEHVGIDTSAALIRRVLGRSIELGRRYGQSGRKDDLYEALRLLGTGLHCLEDYAAHSNYTELSLIELGESEVFPHVGRDTRVEVGDAEIYPIVTGTFGGVDFFHSVLGELSDKTMQSEIESLENAIADSEDQDASESFLQNLLSKIPEGLLGDSNDQTGTMDDFKAKADNAKHDSQEVNPREPEEWTLYLNNVQEQIYPVLEWHDKLLKQISRAIEKIPVLPDLIEQIQDQITIFVFSILAPYVLPIIKQVKSELETGSSEVIQSSREQQHIVFNDDSCSNPTHSMLSKDHFSNVLNEPAGRIASEVVKWTVPQLMQCWDHEDADVDRTLDRIISGVFHHPALRHYGEDGASDIRSIMFSTVEKWWEEKDDEQRDILRDQLSRDGVQEGRNHKDGVQDCGHGCGKPLALPKNSGSGSGSQNPGSSGIESLASEAVGGGAFGGILGGIVGGMGSLLLNNNSSKPDRESPEPEAPSYGSGNDHQSRPHETQQPYGDPYGQVQQQHRPEYGYQADQGYGAPVQREEFRPTPGGYEYQSETTYGQPPVHRDEYVRREEYSGYAPPAGDYQRPEYPSQHPESQGYYQERRETYQTGQSDYRTEYRTEEQVQYGQGPPPIDGYGGGYGGPPPPREYYEAPRE